MLDKWLFTFSTVCAGFFFLAQTACSTTTPVTEALASQHQLQRSVIRGTRYEHVLYENLAVADHARVLHVYIGGDGTPWRKQLPATDPTTRNPLGLKLMTQDTHPAVFVGRPCYDGLATARNCDPLLWTGARYSPRVIESMAAVINRWASAHDFKTLVLIGYSGGGVLATLTAEHVGQTVAVVTVAANLDTDAWLKHHRYEAMNESLNPALQASFTSGPAYIHLQGSRDKVVPTYTTDNYFTQNANAIRWTYPSFDHLCCWEREWAAILLRVDQQLNTALGIKLRR